MLLFLNYIYFIKQGRDTRFAAFCMKRWGQEVPCWTVPSICFCFAFCWWLSSRKSFCFMMEIWKVSKTEVRNTGKKELLRTVGNSALTSQKADAWQKKNWWSQVTTSTWLHIISSVAQLVLGFCLQQSKKARGSVLNTERLGVREEKLCLLMFSRAGIPVSWRSLPGVIRLKGGLQAPRSQSWPEKVS